MSILKKQPALLWGLSVTLFFLFIWNIKIGFIESLELTLYDVMMQLKSEPDAESNIILVNIDDDSIDKLGRWPWPRTLLAQGIDKVNAGKPKIIGFNILLSEPEKSEGLKELAELEDLFSKEFIVSKELPLKSRDKGQKFLQTIKDAQIRLDNDKKLEESLANSEKIVLPIYFKSGTMAIQEILEENDPLIPYSIANVVNSEGLSCYTGFDIIQPIPRFLNTSKGVGHLNIINDIDGRYRGLELVYYYKGFYFPSYAFLIATKYLNIPLDQINGEMGSFLKAGNMDIEINNCSNILVSFKGAVGSFKNCSFFDVINDKVPSSFFRNKIVLINPAASGIVTLLSTPTDNYMSSGEYTANCVWTILNQNFIKSPEWAGMFEFLMILALGIIITFIFPKMKAMLAGITFVTFILAMIVSAIYFFKSNGLWIKISYPFLELLIGYIGVVSLKYFVTEAHKVKAEGESAETNRMLGMSFQAQGMLDMAFEKFQKVPVDNSMKGLLYNLALDFERKRQFNKAAAVFEYIEEYDPNFKDISERKKRLIHASETMIFGDSLMAGSSSGGGLLSTGTDTKPTLGRYEVTKQLGKGAMGIVYLAKDPRIDRAMAIKTFRLTEEIEESELAEVKERFFQEAKSAGTLSHPHIVTIYDAGEEQELAYIAMEFLEGEDLQKYSKKDNLIPMRKVIDYVADIAEALDYAHEKGIVHRDIKPANIMLLNSGVVKITDFGIARITGSSKTQTGVVKGTPYYMAPEQIAGEKVDGRADIFSLGVMLFQLLTGELPFSGENFASLMHQIINTTHPDPRKYNPQIAKPLVAIINKALVKKKDNRYQKAGQMAAHLREVGKRIDIALNVSKGNAK
ncbi:MAG: CHASE2 domain-containing protein [Desulfobacterales bacterium]|nr:CHASE2 domain-containing protein [Desulfobacterales bacterium]